MKIAAGLCAAACFLSLGTVLGGGSAPDSRPAECRSKRPISEFPVDLGKVFEVVIGEDTIDTVQKKLGVSRLVRVSEAAGSEICYRLSQEKPHAYVVFEFGPLGGFDYVTGYKVSRTPSGRTEADCARAAPTLRAELVKGLRLGMTKEQFTEALGAGACEGKSAIEYRYAGKRRMDAEELARFGQRDPAVEDNPYFFVSAGISGRFDQSGLREISVYKTESY